MSEDQNVVYIGRKPVTRYVLAIITHLNRTGAKEVVLKARGSVITTAVDTAEVTRRRFMETLQVDKKLTFEQNNSSSRKDVKERCQPPR
jgi:DNA-binding protein Alba